MPRIRLHLSQEIEAGRHLPLQLHKQFVFVRSLNIIVSRIKPHPLVPGVSGRASIALRNFRDFPVLFNSARDRQSACT